MNIWELQTKRQERDYMLSDAIQSCTPRDFLSFPDDAATCQETLGSSKSQLSMLYEVILELDTDVEMIH